MRKKSKFWIPVFVWAGVIFSFSSITDTGTTGIYWKDFIVKKTAHLVVYGILFLLFYRALTNTTRLDNKRAAFYSLIFIFLYGASDEFHQSFVPGREGKVRDVIIDTAGGILSWYFLWSILPKTPAKLRNWAKSLQLL